MPKIPHEKRILNEKQKQAVEYGSGPLMIIAGAGTGKTTVVTERIKYLIASGKALPTEILALTFTEKASREMEERIETMLPYGIPEMWISTFHSFCDKILRVEAVNIGIDPGYRLMTEAETIQFFRKHLFDFDLDYFRPLGNPTKFIKGMLQHFSRLKDEDINPIQYLSWVNSKFEIRNSKQNRNLKRKENDDNKNEEYQKFTELANAYRKYEELKVKDSLFDYADLISNTLKLFRIRPNILKNYQRQFKYILVDEFQDTNIAQNELVILLAGKKANITVVLDDDQAIYRWRGAAVSNALDFRKKFKKARVIVLTDNYRSTRTILDLSYKLIQNNNPDRLEIAEKITKKLHSVRNIAGDNVRLLYADRVENEAEFVVSEIEKLQKEKNYMWSDFAILVRANNHSDPFVRAFSRKGIPYQFLGPGQLFRQAEVKDLISYLKILYNFEDNVAVYRVLNMDYQKIDSRDIAVMINYSRKYGLPVFEVCEIIADSQKNRAEMSIKPAVSINAKTRITEFVNMVYRHLDLVKSETAGQILYYFLSDSGLLKQFASYKSPKEERIAGNIAKFFDKLKSYEAGHEDAGIFTVVDWIDLSMDLGESPLASDNDWTENNAVNIITVHSAKGLEFPVVFMVNLVSARFPTVKRSEQVPIPDSLVKETLPSLDPHLLEERRLFYVGMTRARDLLYFTAAKYYGEGKREKKLSLFITEVVDEKAIESFIKRPLAEETQLSFLDWQKAEEPQISAVSRTVNYLSYSQIASFTTCPLQYKYRNILRIPVPASAALIFGSAIHSALEKFYNLHRQGIKPDLSRLLEIFNHDWSDIGYGSKAYAVKMKKRGTDILADYYDNFYDKDEKVLDVEKKFRIRISPELFLGGKIDRVNDLGRGKLEIIDYKTGAAPKTKNISNDEQLTVYALAASDRALYNKNPEEVTVTFYFLDGCEKVSGQRSQESLDKMKEFVLRKSTEIGSSDFKPTPGKHCDFCDFRLICEAWN